MNRLIIFAFKAHLMLLKRSLLMLLISLWALPGMAQRQGNVGTSLSLDGAAYVNVGDLDITTGQFTIECLTNLSSTAYGGIFSKVDGSGSYGYGMLAGSIINAGNVQRNIYSGVNYSLNTWYHMAMVYDGASLRYYGNFCLLDSVAITGTLRLDNNNSLIGKQADQPNSFDGLLDELKIWTTARTIEEMKQTLFGVGNPASEPNLLAYYKFENNFNNLTGSGFNGVGIGNPTFVNSGDIMVPVLEDFTVQTTDVSCINVNDGTITLLNPLPIVTTSLNQSQFAYRYYYDNLAPGTYNFTVRADVGCMITKPVTIMNVPNAGLGASANPNPVCNGQSLNLGATVNGDPSLVTFSWSGPANYSGNGQNPPPVTNTTTANLGTYTVTAQFNSCITTATVNVTGGINPPTPNAGPDFSVCEFDAIQLQATSPVPAVTYSWTGPVNFTAGVDDPVINRAEIYNSGDYVVQTNDGGCLSNPDTVHVTVQPSPAPFLGNDTIICPGEPFNLFPGSYVNYTWQDGSLSPLYTVDRPGMYAVEVESSLGCLGSDSIYVREFCPFEVYYPNTFTPDNDGYNEEFFIVANNVVKFDLYIFNRWGEMIFHTKNQTDGWNGTYNGRDVEAGIYAVRAEMTIVDKDGNTTEKALLGNVCVIR